MILKRSLVMLLIPFIYVIIGGINSQLSESSFSSLSFFYNPKQPRISNGQEAKPHQFPYHLSVSSDKYICGSVLINKLWALIPEGCVLSDVPYTVLAGYVNRSNKFDSSCAVEVEVEKVIRYGRAGDHNIALLKLKTPIYQSRGIKYAKLPEKSLQVIGKTAIVMGHGALVEAGPASDTIRYTTVRVTRKCGYDDQNYLCVQGVTPGSNVCAGDFGSPMVLNENRYTLIGLHYSQNTTCGNPNFESSFTNIILYVDWIKEKMESN